MKQLPTRGARQSETWKRSAVRATLVRLAAYGLPILGAWFAIRFTSDHYYRPAGWIGLGAWVIQAVIVAVLASSIVQFWSRRLLPLAFLLDQTLLFPDAAPSRFGAALRAGNIGSVDKRIEEMRDISGDRAESEAALAGLTLVAALSKHDRHTRGHTERVRAYSDLIAEELGLPEEDRQLLAWGVMLHDIGKLTVPPEILNKKEPLDAREWAILQQHPAASAELLGPLRNWLGDWARAAEDHHERWDGAGYPNGKRGVEISLAGRITAVADAYDVITSARSYKPPMDAKEARQELVRCSGTQFDPVVVRAMLNVSLGRRRNLGPLSWLLEIPSLTTIGGAVSSVPASVATASVAIAATATSVVGLEAEPPESLGFADAEEQPDFTADLPLKRRADAGTTTTTVLAAPPESTPIAVELPSLVTTTSTTTTPTTEAGTASTSTSTAPTTISTSSSTVGSSPSTTSTPTTTATTTTTSTTTSTTTTAPLPEVTVLYLTNPGSGNTSSSQPLGLLESASLTASLPNYDVDRNGTVGLTIKKDDKGMQGLDPSKYQDWVFTPAVDTVLSGPTTMTVWVRITDPDEAEDEDRIAVRVALDLCDPDCNRIEADRWSAITTAGFQQAVLDFGNLDTVIPAGATLRMRMVVPDSRSDVDAVIAYDTTSHPSRLVSG